MAECMSFSIVHNNIIIKEPFSKLSSPNFREAILHTKNLVCSWTFEKPFLEQNPIKLVHPVAYVTTYRK